MPRDPASAAQELLRDPITGDIANQIFYDHFDVTELVVNFDMQPGFDRVGGNPVLTFGGLVNPTGNTLRFIVADTSDGILDTTVYFSALAGVGEVPLPASIWLLGTAAFGLAGRSYAKRRKPAADAT